MWSFDLLRGFDLKQDYRLHGITAEPYTTAINQLQPRSANIGESTTGNHGTLVIPILPQNPHPNSDPNLSSSVFSADIDDMRK